MQNFTNKVAAITGAGSGIGRALALDLAGRGTHLALSDIDAVGLAETVTLAEGRGVKVTSQTLDVADRDAVLAWAAAVVADHDKVNLIFNNAGVALGATVAEMSFEDYDWLMGINLGGVVNGTKAFLPHLEASGDGHVINISSVFGLLSIPSQSAYNAAKFAVRGFTDALRIELDVADNGVSSTTIHPGGIKTNIAKNARLNVDDLVEDVDEARAQMDKLFITTPEKAARQILKAVERNRRRALIGPDAKVLDVLSRMPAVVSHKILARSAGKVV